MHKLSVSAYKEVLLLLRDWGGLAILFFMPSVLIITITLIQESTFKAVGESTLPILLVDEDRGEIGRLVAQNLAEAPNVQLITAVDGKPLSQTAASTLVGDGQYQIAIVIPEGLSDELNEKVAHNVDKILGEFALTEADSTKQLQRNEQWDPKEVIIYFDPAAGQAFRNATKNNIEKMLSKVEVEKIYAVFIDQMELEEDPGLLDNEIIAFKETIAQKGNDGIIPNAVQHNVPAWILFGIFFIVVPLGINLVKEKNLGTYIRLRTSPVSYLVILGGKILTYTVICLIQFALMLLIARYVFPLIGLIPFEPGTQLPLMILIAFISGLAAIGLGILIGTIAETQEQSAPFGAIFVIILAALGGVWVPTFIMPEVMQKVSAFSPMNWGISAFYDVILRHGTAADIAQPLSFLLLFFAATLLAAILYDKRHQSN
ncbi:ABC transporter permease [Parapedobacter koreensis]|uniref:ABC-2 type transport system permease protein n=1 Tax=Parapedobacter koreensis TaxID=332977 RepID=A0A1H7S8U5_9SPHI|nr:ABC transporter permease [Parapedobacter koreensis]SEL69042.1 ABC-2 type transport system permease protein [Parapedobacter koreensis]